MAVSYLMFLQKEHPEIAFASINYRGHVSKLGSEKEKMLYLYFWIRLTLNYILP